MISKILSNNFEIGRDKHILKTAFLNKYAKFFQSCLIPRCGHMAIILNDEDAIKKQDSLSKIFNDINSTNPPFLNETFKTVSFKKKNWIYALQTYFDKEFPIYSENKKNQLISQFKSDFLSKFSDNFNSKIFNEYKKKKSQLYEESFELKLRDPVLHLISDCFNINIFMLNNLGYKQLCFYKANSDNVVLFEFDNDIGIVINSQDVNITTSFTNLEPIRTKKIQILSNEEKATEYAKIIKFTKKQLEIYVEQNFSFSIENKTKEDILNDIISNM